MKIFDTATTREADKVTIEKQGITYHELMERAGNEAYLWLKAFYPDKDTLFHIFCGHGNNGGDGLVIARLLHEAGYNVLLDIVENTGNPSENFSENLKKIDDAGIKYNQQADYSEYKGTPIVIDAIFGIGLTREPGESVKTVIENINRTETFVISIDMPSGVFMDRKTHFAVESDVVLTFQQPKLAFYLADNFKYIKKIEILDIGLDREFIESIDTHYSLTDYFEAHKRLRPVRVGAHKGIQGHALIIGGSYGKIGAVTLSAKAALKSGCGLVTAYIPKCGYNIVQTAFPEAMVITDGEEQISNINFGIKPDAIGIGMGIGQAPETQNALHDFLKLQKGPLVIDADALNILSYNKDWLKLLPADSIITPHPKELERLIGSWEDDFDKLKKAKAFSTEYNIIVVAKDARTLVISGSHTYINSTGNPALATAGSGDVLTGIITGLIAQSYSPVDAAIFGVYLHGLTADVAVPETSIQAFTASSILEYMAKAYIKIDANMP